MHLYPSKISFPFFVVSLSGFGIMVLVVSQNEFGSVPSFSIFWNSLRRTGISSSLYVWYYSPVKPSSPGLLFAGSFYYKFNFTTSDQSVPIVCFFLTQFWKVVYVQTISRSQACGILD